MISSKVLAFLATVLLIITVIAVAVSNMPGARGEVTVEELTKIQGYVLDAETNAALLEVEIYYYAYSDPTEPVDQTDASSSEEPPSDKNDYRAFTDEKGHYTLSVPGTSGEITFYLKGYERKYEVLKLEGTSSLWLNMTLKEIPPPPEPDAVLKGIVTDEDTGDPISGMMLSLYREYNYDEPEKAKPDEPEPERDSASNSAESSSGQSTDSTGTDEEYYNTNWASGTTGSSGEYEIKLFYGSYWLSAYEEYSYERGPNYYSYSAKVEVEENSTTYYNFSVKALPPRDAFVKGYVTDSTTGKALEYISVNIYKIYDEDTGDSTFNEPASTNGLKAGYDGFFADDYAYGVTDSDGFYKLNIRQGTYSVNAGGYVYYYDDDVDIIEPGIPRDENGDDDKPPPPSNDAGGESDETFSGTRGADESDEKVNVGAPEPDLGIDISPRYENEYYPFYTTVEVDAKSTVWLNISLKPIPPKNSKITGIVKDKDTGEPISNAQISLIGYTQGYQNYYWDDTDASGRYELSVREGFYVMSVNYYYYFIDDIYETKVYEEEDTGSTGSSGGSDGSPGSETPLPPESKPPEDGNEKQYFPYSTTLLVSPETTVKHDVMLVPYPEETSTLHGKITDKQTGTALSGVSIMFEITVGENSYSKYDWTNTDGEYSTSVPGSTVTIMVNSYYHFDYPEEAKDDGLVSIDSEGSGTRSEPADPNNKPGGDLMPDLTRYFGFRAEIKVDANSDITYNIELEPEPDRTCVLTGTVLDVDGSAVQYAWVGLIDQSHITDEYSMFSNQAWTDEAGKFTLEIYPGKFGLVADKSWYMAVDGTATSYQQVEFTNDNEDKTVTINLKSADNNKIDLNFKFDSWQEAGFTAKVSLNENAFGFRYYIDNSFGNGDGKIDSGEVTNFVLGWIAPMGTTPFGQISVDSVTYHPEPGSTSDVTLSGDMAESALTTTSTEPFEFTIKMDIVPYKRISESAAEHDIELVLNEYMPAEISYRIELPDGFELTGYSDAPSGSTVAGLGGGSIYITSPFNYYSWYDFYGKESYAGRSDDSLDAEDAGNLLAGPSAPQSYKTGGENADEFSQGSGEGTNYIRLKVVNDDLKDGQDTTVLSGVHALAISALVIIVILVIFALFLFQRKRKRPSRPEEFDDRSPIDAGPGKRPPTPLGRPKPPL